MTYKIGDLRACAINNTLFKPTNLKNAIARMGFIQADPIRSPATAQDLILRHRVKNYRVGDLEKKYATLDLEEDYLYAYGFLPRDNWQLLHPRKTADLTALERKVLAAVTKYGAMHPRQLEEHFGAERVVNAWGGYSKATTHALEHLRHRGLLRVVRREKGIRIYEAALGREESLSPENRCESLIKLILGIFNPVPRKNFERLPFSKPESCITKACLKSLIDSGEVSTCDVDGISYVYLADRMDNSEAPPTVRFLAPFDPLIWDRNKFETFWGWNYRFEAYTPIAKRIRGYYAMPILWRDEIIGWTNLAVENGELNVEIGYAGKQPRSSLFKSELAAELDRMRKFLRLQS